MTLVSPRKTKEISLKAIKEESLSFKSDDDEKMSEGELTKFAKKFKKYMKFRKTKKESNDDKKIEYDKKIEELNWKIEKDRERCEKKVEN